MIDRRKILIKLSYVIFAILLIVVVFFLTLGFLNMFTSPSSIIPGGNPASPISNSFPPAPSFLKLSGIYFSNLELLKDNNSIENAGIFLILCKKDQDYGIIYIGETGEYIELSNNTCWFDSCQGSLYAARHWMPSERYKTKDRQGLRALLEAENNPSCVLKL